MEYLNSIDDSISIIDESNIEYIDLFQHPELVYGTLNLSSKELDFCKYPHNIQKEMERYGELAVSEMANLNSSACGTRLRISTDSKVLVFKVQLKRKWEYQKMTNWNASGFDVYALQKDQYFHRTVFGPSSGYNIFSEVINVPGNGKVCIFLPNYNTIQKMHIGIENGCEITNLDYPEENSLPIIFYGNSVTQGAAASRSGNTFPNLVSKKLNRDIINLSCSSCCRGTLGMADIIGKINCYAIVIDYTRNAHSTEVFSISHERFYKKIRQYHPNVPIVLLTSECFNGWRVYDEFDEIVKRTYDNAIKNKENTMLLNQRELFSTDEYDYVTIDSSHYTDYGMFKVADKICELLDKK